MLSKLLHSRAVWEIGRPSTWNDNLWSAKGARSLIEQLDPGVEPDLIEHKDFRRDEPDCKTNYQRSERK